VSRPAAPESPNSRDFQESLRRSRSYGSVNADPASPIEGWAWFRRDLNPPELRVKLDGTNYKVTLTPA